MSDKFELKPSGKTLAWWVIWAVALGALGTVIVLGLLGYI